jgi:hypothetical protein
MDHAKRTVIRANYNPLLTSIEFDSATWANVFAHHNALSKVSFQKARIIQDFYIDNEQHLQGLVNVFPNADTVDIIQVFACDSLLIIHEDAGPKHILVIRADDNTASVNALNDRLEEFSGFPNLRSYKYAPFAESFGLKAPSMNRYIGFNKLDSTNVGLGVVNNGKIIGFNGLTSGEVGIGVGKWPDRLEKVIGFHNLKNGQVRINYVNDTLIGFNSLKNGGIEVKVSDKCFVHDSVFSEFENGGVWNCWGWYDSLHLSRKNLIKFPSLTTGGFHTWDNPAVESLKDVYPKLKNITSSTQIINCTALKSLDGIENIASYKVSGWNPMFDPWNHIVITGCDSLTDCSALCYILKNATFFPPQFNKIIDNPQFPCTDLTTVLGYCDTLTSPVEQEIRPVEADKPIFVYPNPENTGLLNIELADEPDGLFAINVFDQAGRNVLSGSLHFRAGKAVLRTDMLENGWHNLVIKRKDAPISVSFIREKLN